MKDLILKYSLKEENQINYEEFNLILNDFVLNQDFQLLMDQTKIEENQMNEIFLDKKNN